VEQCFCCPDVPLVTSECCPENVEMGVVTFQHAFDVLVGFRADTELHGSAVSEREVVSFFVVGSKRVRAVFGV
jgi:hypothetical protein